MKNTLKEIFTNWRVLLLVFFVLMAIVAIKPQITEQDGILIRNVLGNSTASLGGIENPSVKLKPLEKERILKVDGQTINSVGEYFRIVSTIGKNQTVQIKTNKRTYTLISANYNPTELGLVVYEIPTSNIRKGLDLEGGTRVLLKPAEPVSAETLEITIDSLKERLNVYGLGDVVVRSATDLAGEQFILVEIAGVTENEVKDLLARQGKFEAQINNQTVFLGGERDITYVCRSAECSGINPNVGCGQTGDGYACGFFFAISLTPQAAQRHAQITDKLTVVASENNAEGYLSEDLILFLDDKEVDRLRIGAELKGRATTNIQISGSGSGTTIQAAQDNALLNMKRLQTIILTGSLPVKLNIEKMDTISPSLGREFLSNILFVAALVILVVISVVLLRYKNIKVVVPMVSVLLSEMVLILGFAALANWNLDLAGIAGIIIVAGTGVDHLIVITDEVLKGETIYNWKVRIKNAMFIIMGAYFTTLAGMLPLYWAGAGLLKGFALTTIAGISFGVLIARPAYAAIIEKILNK